MQKGKLYYRAFFFILVTLVIFLFSIGVTSEIKDRDSDVVPYQDKITGSIYIDTLNKLGDLERLPVMFSHDLHTDALSEFDRHCDTCHMMDGDNLSPKFKRLTDNNRKVVMQTYHTNCIGCHLDPSVSKEKFKPITCEGCHSTSSKEPSLPWNPIRFDKYLHYKHTLSNSNKCEICHHEYDNKNNKLIYNKGSEGSCEYCHIKNPVDDISSLKEASHQFCIGCHREKDSNKIKCGPIKCVGCHGSNFFDNQNEDIPRIDRGQPDRILVKNESDKIKTLTGYMDPVVFDHELHEKINDTCIVCHHNSLESCSKCHTKAGNVDGKYINIADAMHNKNAKSSCIGCHQSKQKESQCNGCHSSIKSKSNEKMCNSCHVEGLISELISCDSDESREHIIAEKLGSKDVLKVKLYDKESIPENVNINILEKEYEKVTFPHRKIILSMFDHMKDNKLATYFHTDQGTLCLGCHHNSPSSEKPPACVSCHGFNTNISMPFKPRLVAAYHQKCIKCHDSMNLEKPDSRDCTACHANKGIK